MDSTLVSSALLLVFFVPTVFAGAVCRCLFSQACWPDVSTWQYFNTSVDGNLLIVRPPGAACHIPSYDPAACTIVKQNAIDPFWRADQPGAIQSAYNEMLPNQSCLLTTTPTTPCGQGAVPIYVVNVTRACQVQKTVAFVSKYNLRLVVKNTGHDVTGRSTAAGSLSIWVHNLKSITFPSSNSVKVGAGVQWEELYKAVDEHRRTIAGSECTSVGAAGGYVQGGGHSSISPTFGLAADNIIEYEVVKADGSLVVANEFRNQSLFWALKGGGGGTFGIVTSATYATYPALQSLVFASFVISSSSRSAFKSFLSYFLAFNVQLSGENWGGVFILGNNTLTIRYLLPDISVSFANQTFHPLFVYVGANSDLTVSGSMQNFPSYYAWHLATQCPGGKCGFPSGFSVLEASRLIPRTTLLNSSPQLASTLISIYDSLQPYLIRLAGYLVAGGRVSVPRNSAVNPAWRNAVLHILIVQELPDDLSEQGKENLKMQLTNITQVLQDFTPGSGTYMNEGNINEPNWQQSFFGSHYKTLKSIKKKVDPKGLFICRHCVGSEEWSEDLNCRVP